MKLICERDVIHLLEEIEDVKKRAQEAGIVVIACYDNVVRLSWVNEKIKAENIYRHNTTYRGAILEIETNGKDTTWYVSVSRFRIGRAGTAYSFREAEACCIEVVDTLCKTLWPRKIT